MKKFVFEWRGLVDASNKAWGSFETLDNLSINIPLVGYFIFFAIGSSPWFVFYFVIFFIFFILFLNFNFQTSFSFCFVFSFCFDFVSF